MIAWWAIAGARGHNEIYKPGPVSSAHAMWENNCAACHDNDGKGGFRAAISDNACLKCHEAEAHSPKQILRQGINADNPLALATIADGGAIRSADCVACHVEHRGRHSLASISDAHCTQCHSDLQKSLKPAATLESPARVVGFNSTGNHPYFGREWARSQKLQQPPGPFDPHTLVDPTRLKFNHKVHMREVKPAAGEMENCGVCHANQDAAKQAQAQRYMQPVSYAAHCQSCHPLNLPSGVPVVHDGMEAVEAQLLSLPELHRQWLIRAAAAEQQNILKGQSPESWVAQATDHVQQTVSDWLLEMSPKNAHGAEDVARVIQEFLPGDEHSGSDPRALALYVAFGAHDQPTVKAASCSKCHDMEDVAARVQPGSSPSTQPSIPVLRTVPTGIPATPRRWFRHSTFDHASHEGISCTGCHSDAPKSEKTTDLLLPNLTWKDADGSAVSCARCHHEEDSDGLGAPAHCVTCHTFHDHSAGKSMSPKLGVLAILNGNETTAAATHHAAIVGVSSGK